MDRTTSSRDEYQWESTFAGVFRLVASANRSTGRIDVSVVTTVPFASLALLATFGILGIYTVAPSSIFLFLGLATSLSLILIPLLGIYVLMQQFHRHTSDVVRIEDVGITPYAIPPLIAFLVGMWVVGSSSAFHLLTAFLALFLVVFFAYITTLGTTKLRRQAFVWVYAFCTGFPLLLTVGNFGMIAVFGPAVSARAFVYLLIFLCLWTLMALIAYAYLCQMMLSAADSLPNKPINSLPERIAWSGYFLSLNLTMLISIGLLAVAFFRSPGITPLADFTNIAVNVAALPVPAIIAILLLGILACPVIMLAGFWIHHLVGRVHTYRRITRHAYDVPEIDASVPTLVLDTSRIVATPIVTIRGNQTILLSSKIIDLLEDDELAAVVAHEEYHLNNGDLRWNALASIVGLAVGGKNALLAIYDYPRVEREADLYASELVGTDPMIRALRRLEASVAVDSHSPSNDQMSDNDLRGLLSAPYRILFGPVIFENAHASVDDRIEYLLDEDST